MDDSVQIPDCDSHHDQGGPIGRDVAVYGRKSEEAGNQRVFRRYARNGVFEFDVWQRVTDLTVQLNRKGITSEDTPITS